jgi:hypothetical protein
MLVFPEPARIAKSQAYFVPFIQRHGFELRPGDLRIDNSTVVEPRFRRAMGPAAKR